MLAALREALDRAGVHLERTVLLGLAHLDVVERSAVEDDLRLDLGEGLGDRLVVRDVQVAPLQSNDVIQLLGQVRCELAATPRYEGSHVTELNDSRRGFSSLRSSSQRML